MCDLTSVGCCVQLYHPSALSMFDHIVCESKGKQIVTFLDYDGTLSPIVADPDKAYMSKKVHPFVLSLFFLFFHSNFSIHIYNKNKNM